MRLDGIATDGTAGAPLSRALALLFAAASGLAVANAYFAHPLLDVMADGLDLPRATVGLVVGATQVGYGLGLILLVPVGDLVDRRKLVIIQSLLMVLALLSVGFAPTGAALLAAMAAMGFFAVITQAFVAYAASLARPDERGTVTSGIVIGILLARTVAGALADVSGWRTVYLLSAALTLVITAILVRVLPAQPKQGAHVPYPRLIASLATLFREEPVLRVRAILAMLIFADITTLLTPLVLPLSAPPYSLSHTMIGLFGLAGVAGALGAARAGHWTDRGLGQRVTGIALALMLVSWLPIALLPYSILWLVLGVIVLDFGLQAVHVTNQGLIYRVRPEAQSRLTAAYMVFYSIGSALGSSSSTAIYAYAGWTGVCLLGAGIAAVALLLWAFTLQR
ncbi:MFS transporter [Chelatococcus sp. GW1]|uniref:MFS transporter n=1 Tax=Chelatococcus sp. GW1 TaxID=1211115 RepID=UPI000684FF92|nr:MFS transporter [Chelatococcus sp. GW1]